MQYSAYKSLVKSDLYRYYAKISWSSFIWSMIRIPGFQYSFWMRTSLFVKQNQLFNFFFFPSVRIILKLCEYIFGISIPYQTEIGSGFYIGHFGGIVINKLTKIGKNCNISHCVTIGQSSRGSRKGCPTIGDCVYIGPGAKIIGNVKIGNNVAIGANCVVTSDIPNDAVVVGIPGKVISLDGAEEYILNIDYETIK